MCQGVEQHGVGKVIGQAGNMDFSSVGGHNRWDLGRSRLLTGLSSHCAQRVKRQWLDILKCGG